MGLLDAIAGAFSGNGDKDTDSGFDWQPIESTEQVDEVLLASNTDTRIIFKHSPRCATSYFARNDLEKYPKEETESLVFHMIDVIRHREVSRYLADRVEVRHESPQVFVICNGEVVWHGSHHHVQSDNIRENLPGSP